MCNRLTIHDMLINKDYATGGKSMVGENYGISNIASLPDKFTTDFTLVSVGSGATATGVAKDMHNAVRCAVQIVMTTVGAGFSKCDFKVQKSNVGGSAAEVWSDVTSATLSLTAVGSGFIEMPNGGLHNGKFLRVIATTTGGTATFYAVGVAHTN